MYCGKCGEEVNSNDKFCKGCGNKIESDNLDSSLTESSKKHINNFEGKRVQIDSTSSEKSITYKTDEGIISEKRKVNYKVDNGNKIDNAINTISDSKSVKKVASFINKIIRLGITGFTGLFAGGGSYELGRKSYRHLQDNWVTVWEVSQEIVIAGSIGIGLITALIVFILYSKWFIK